MSIDPKNSKSFPNLSGFHQTWQNERSFTPDHRKLNFFKIGQELTEL